MARVKSMPRNSSYEPMIRCCLVWSVRIIHIRRQMPNKWGSLSDTMKLPQRDILVVDSAWSWLLILMSKYRLTRFWIKRWRKNIVSRVSLTSSFQFYDLSILSLMTKKIIGKMNILLKLIIFLYILFYSITLIRNSLF